MMPLAAAVDDVLAAQQKSGKPLAIILAGHNGSGKSTMWYEQLAPQLQIPLVNADRMMLSILPETSSNAPLPDWARTLRDGDESWMKVAQNGVQAFVAEALSNGVPFAMETVFSHWKELPDDKVESKIDQILQMQRAGYFVVLFFVGLANQALSVLRVETRVRGGGHAVDAAKLAERFPRTQKAIRAAASVANAAILVDNSREQKYAFSVCRVQLKKKVSFDIRLLPGEPLTAISSWLDIVAPMEGAAG
ncbi:MAG: zeta toxin family protein [Sphingomonas sp.]|uniref:zeta toxin family protein n=1 Tax=Sphingomonas sp. TaxID=28214 RepID=UPI003F7CF0EB